MENEIKASARTLKTTNSGHGRVETRGVTTLPAEHLDIDFHDAKQVVRIERSRLTVLTRHESREYAYFITSLPRRKAGAKYLLNAVRAHWGIENSLHYVRDVTFGEDFCRVRSESSPEILAALRNVCVRLMKRIHANCAYGQRYCASRMVHTVKFVLSAVP